MGEHGGVNSILMTAGALFSVFLIIVILMRVILEIQVWWIYSSPVIRVLIKIFMLLLAIVGMVIWIIYILHLLR